MVMLLVPVRAVVVVGACLPQCAVLPRRSWAGGVKVCARAAACLARRVARQPRRLGQPPTRALQEARPHRLCRRRDLLGRAGGGHVRVVALRRAAVRGGMTTAERARGLAAKSERASVWGGGRGLRREGGSASKDERRAVVRQGMWRVGGGKDDGSSSAREALAKGLSSGASAREVSADLGDGGRVARVSRG